MASRWERRRLGDVCRISHGYAFAGAQFSNDSSFPTLVTPGNFGVGGGFREAKTKTFKGPIPDGYALSGGDLIVTMTDLSTSGDTLGYSARVPSSGTYLHNQRIGRVSVVRTDLVERDYLYWVMRTAAYRHHVLSTASGSTVRHTSPDRILEFVCPFPPLAEQRRIAGVLGALDDLIEVNRGLIGDLLATAEAIAHSDALQGETRTFGDVCDVFGGGTPSTKNSQYWNGEIRWATPTDMTALPSPYLFDTSRRITAAGLESCASKLMPRGSILMTSRATIGAFAIAQEPTAVNQGFIAIEPRQEIDRWFLFHEMRRRVPEFIQRANGSTFLELSRGVFKALEINWPTDSARANLFAKVDPLHGAAASLQQEIAELQATRDELLPLLLSGRVRVAEIVAA